MEFNVRQKKVINAEENKILCLATAACGKALPNSVVLPTPYGNKRVGDVKLGDVLFDRTGNPTKVLGIFPQGYRDVYQITFADGRKAVSSIDHIWYVRQKTLFGKSEYKEMTLEEIIYNMDNIYSYKNNYYVPLSDKVKYSNIKELDTDPYLYGVALQTLSYASDELRFIDKAGKLKNIMKYIGSLINGISIKKNDYWVFKSVRTGEIIQKKEIFSDDMIKSYHNTSIPDRYKYSSINDRFRLIQGILDSKSHVSVYDGTYAKKSFISYFAFNNSYGKDIKEILGSLGYVTTLNENSCLSYTMMLKDNKDIAKLFLLSDYKAALSDYDKKAKVKEDNKIVKIESLGYTEEMTCFYVDNDEHLFLTENFIVTHNTRILTERIRKLVQDDDVDAKDIVAITFTNMAAAEMKKRLEPLGDNRFNDVYIGTIHGYANMICFANGIDTKVYISLEQYDRILEEALKVPKKKMPHVKHVLVDECQDLSPLEYKFFSHLNTDNIFYVGDNRQCQPESTKVLLKDNTTKNIEDIEVGDIIIGYDNKNQSFNNEKKVIKTAVREFVNDNLITVKTNTHETRYTPNHISFVRFNENENVNIVYLELNDKGQYNIDVIELKYLINRFKYILKQNNSKLWILKCFKEKRKANEFQMENLSKYIPLYNDAAAQCLKEYNRDINYPLITSSSKKDVIEHNKPFEIFATNIIPNIMDVITYESGHQIFEAIEQVTYSLIKEPIKVYSLETEGGTYIADNVITHNCIYQFRGSSDEYLMSMYRDSDFKKYYLTDNYRNAPNIVRFADEFLMSMPQISPSSNPIKTSQGNVEKCSLMDALDELEYVKNWGSWFVLTRTNEELKIVMDMLEKREIPCVTFKKKDISLKQLEEIMAGNKVKVLTIHMSKGLENKNVIVIGARTFNEEERKISYVAATRAEANLYWCPSPSGALRSRVVNKRAKAFEKAGIIEF